MQVSVLWLHTFILSRFCALLCAAVELIVRYVKSKGVLIVGDVGAVRRETRSDDVGGWCRSISCRGSVEVLGI
jgi:hypothetical protein